MSSELYEHHCNSSTGKVLFTAAKMLCQMLEADVPMVLPQDADLPAVIHVLACQAITVCNSGRKKNHKTIVCHFFFIVKVQKIEHLSIVVRYVIYSLCDICPKISDICKTDFLDGYRSASGLSRALQEHPDGRGCLSTVSTVWQLWICSQSKCHFLDIFRMACGIVNINYRLV